MFDSQRLSVKFAGAWMAFGVDATVYASAAQPVRLDTNHVASNHSVIRESSFASRSRCASLLSNIKYTQAPASHLLGNIKTMRTAGRPCAHPMTTRSNGLAAGVTRMSRAGSPRMPCCGERCAGWTFWSNAK
ncbi:MAG: hypothetical protein RXS25_24465 [Paraburkholderia sp.]|uniref:hypothetical protein n=1 Tax=Paraburkholderia sp. TaxID=1926495 RepID=UPI0039782D03